MKKVISVYVSIILVLILSGCSEQNAEEESLNKIASQTYNPIEEVSIDIPKAYEKMIGQYDIEYYKKSDATIMVTSEEVEEPKNNLVNYAFYAMEEYSKSFDEIKNEQNYEYKVDGLDCRVNEFIYVMKGQTDTLERYCYIGYIIKDNVVYVVSCISKVETFEYNKEAFEFTVKSIKISERDSEE